MPGPHPVSMRLLARLYFLGFEADFPIVMPFNHVFGRHRHCDVVTLGEIAAHGFQQRPFGLQLDAFGDGL